MDAGAGSGRRCQEGSGRRKILRLYRPEGTDGTEGTEETEGTDETEGTEGTEGAGWLEAASIVADHG